MLRRRVILGLVVLAMAYLLWLVTSWSLTGRELNEQQVRELFHSRKYSGYYFSVIETDPAVSPIDLPILKYIHFLDDRIIALATNGQYYFGCAWTDKDLTFVDLVGIYFVKDKFESGALGDERTLTGDLSQCGAELRYTYSNDVVGPNATDRENVIRSRYRVYSIPRIRPSWVVGILHAIDES